MARARNIKPAFFANDGLADIEPLGRLLFIGLWTIADREGRLEDRPRRIKAEVLPYDNCDVDKFLDDLQSHGFVQRYEAGGIKCVQITNFTKHQNPHYKEVASALPAPDGHQDSGSTPGGVPESIRQAIFERDNRACISCGSTEDLSIDHVIPRSKGGSHDEDNLQTLCRRCNSAKNNRQAKAEVNESSVDDRPMIGSPSPGQSPLIPDSGFPLTDSGSQREAAPESPPAAQPGPAPKKASSARATRLPESWRLPTAWRDWALSERPDWSVDDVCKVADKFRDHWIAQGGASARKVSWEATWRNWVRREQQSSAQSNSGFDPVAYVNRNRTRSQPKGYAHADIIDA